MQRTQGQFPAPTLWLNNHLWLKFQGIQHLLPIFINTRHTSSAHTYIQAKHSNSFLKTFKRKRPPALHWDSVKNPRPAKLPAGERKNLMGSLAPRKQLFQLRKAADAVTKRTKVSPKLTAKNDTGFRSIRDAREGKLWILSTVV